MLLVGHWRPKPLHYHHRRLHVNHRKINIIISWRSIFHNDSDSFQMLMDDFSELFFRQAKATLRIIIAHIWLLQIDVLQFYFMVSGKSWISSGQTKGIDLKYKEFQWSGKISNSRKFQNSSTILMRSVRRVSEAVAVCSRGKERREGRRKKVEENRFNRLFHIYIRVQCYFL